VCCIRAAELDAAFQCRHCIANILLIMATCRRAKRLRKLTKMLTSRLAQTATYLFAQHTWIVLLLLMLAHIVCFAVLTIQVS